MLFEIDNNLWQFDDERVDKLYENKISQEDFIKLIRPDDPFFIVSGKLIVLTKEIQEKNISNFISSRKREIEKTGDIKSVALYENQSKLLKIYPELKEVIDLTNKTIANEKNCSNCAKNRISGSILEALLKLPYNNRDLSTLDWFSELNIRKLKGESIDTTNMSISLPQPLIKRNIPLRSSPRIKLNNGIIAEDTKTTTLTKALQKHELVENSNGIIRPSCGSCTTKHLSSALALLNLFQSTILLKEMLQGYTIERGYQHYWLALGHLAEAADEIVKEDPELASEIRKIRLEVMEQVQDAPTK